MTSDLSPARYRPLQLSSSLAESLRQCSVVEFPELHVVLSSHVSGYTAGQGGSELAGGDGSKVSSLAWLAESYVSEEEGEGGHTE